ncbi:cytochrome b5 domain-containing protein RLF-like [Magnolia sinica]|uniref:cytochrome b5 domain-containing protein RLF-like n=1 Tax=Magnolia sinica TaxID=86752 RepID=UPI0026589389|nr:cytochrome b5 domain-containing protein RLF-like [Magnolia sinica]XP_058073694.1 cytochrome b5 domain-containing protein RLF-like [Magnolia sinica]
MDNASDFTFWQVDLKIDEADLESPRNIPNIGAITIEDGLSTGTSVNKIDDSPAKYGSLDGATSKRSAAIDSLPPKSNVSEFSEPGNVGDDVNGSQEQKIVPRKPAVRVKIPFAKGHSQMDWLKITRTHPDLAGLKGQSNKRFISMEEVKQHKTEGSIWTVLKGRVYNISPYMKFHPGGVDMLTKAAGKDCTSLFDKYHAWVNADFLLEKCLVGILDDSR